MTLKDEKVAIILLNWNSYEDTYECLRSLEKLSYQNFSIFLIDNNSEDQSFITLENDYKNNKFDLDITFIQTGKNLGFAGGNNVGIKAAYESNYDFIWLLNNDTIVHPESLSSLMRTITSDQKIGIVGSKILYYNTNLIWFYGGTVNKFSGVTKHIAQGLLDGEEYNKVQEVDYITGCSLLFRSGILSSVGFMVEDYFLYYEETDWNLKVKKQNWKIVLDGNSVVEHKVSSSVKKNNYSPPYVNYYDIRNKYIMSRRNLNNTHIKEYLILDVFKKLLKIIFKERSNMRIRFLYVYHALKDIKSNKMGKHPEIS